MIEPMPFRCRCGHEIITHPAAPIVDCAACGGRTWLRTGCYQPVGPRPEFVPPRGGSGGINRSAGPPAVDIAQKLVDAVPMLGEAISEIERLRIRIEAAEARVEELEAREKAALDLLAQVQCPRCGGTGYVYPVSPLDGKPHPDACDWCRIYAALAAEEG